MANRIGIIGGGQLGRFLAKAAKRLGFHVTILDPTPNSPAGQVADEQILGDFKDARFIRKLAKKIDYLTFEIELANAEILKELTSKGIKVSPSAESLLIIKDKLKQKTFLRNLKIPVADFKRVSSKKEIREAGKKFGYPILLKARFDAYDGRGNFLIKKPEDIETALKKLSNRKLYVEKFVSFSKELAINVARSINGDIATHPLVETIHKNNICHIVKVGNIFKKSIRDKAAALAANVMRHLKGAGLFSIVTVQHLFFDIYFFAWLC
ncbi:MAG: ATP-grasp domain-containing protein [bacterium]|nr:ATP-grasp domain-containing protein [bacterium]